MTREMIQYDWTGVQVDKGGLPPTALEKLAPALNRARDAILTDRRPGDSGFVDLPDQIMTAYRKVGPRSELGRILATAQRLRDAADCVILLGSDAYSSGPRALMEACVHPYHNELSRADRGGIPRVYFSGDNLDNDAGQALLDLLTTRKSAAAAAEPWGIVVIGDRNMGLATEAALRIFVRELQMHGGTTHGMADFVVPISERYGLLFDLANEIACPEVFELPDGVAGRFSVLTAAGLMPSALLGIDVVQLLEGARAMNEHFRSVPSGQNCVLQYAGVCHAMAKEHDVNDRALSIWPKALNGIAWWYEPLVWECVGKCVRRVTPWTGEDSRIRLMTNFAVDESRCDPIRLDRSWDHSLHLSANCTVPELTAMAIAAADRKNRDHGRPTATIRLPQLNEYYLGQLFQMLMLATEVERHVGVGANSEGSVVSIGARAREPDAPDAPAK